MYYFDVEDEANLLYDKVMKSNEKLMCFAFSFAKSYTATNLQLSRKITRYFSGRFVELIKNPDIWSMDDYYLLSNDYEVLDIFVKKFPSIDFPHQLCEVGEPFWFLGNNSFNKNSLKMEIKYKQDFIDTCEFVIGSSGDNLYLIKCGVTCYLDGYEKVGIASTKFISNLENL